MLNTKKIIKKQEEIHRANKLLSQKFNLDVIDIAIILAISNSKNQELPRKHLFYRFSNLATTMLNKKISSLIQMDIIKKTRASYDERTVILSLHNSEYTYNKLKEIEKVLQAHSRQIAD